MRYTGDKMVIRYGTLDISGQARTLDVDESVPEVDATAYASTDREFILGMPERTGGIEIMDDDTSSTVRQAIALGTSNSLTWFPLGTASGLPKHQCGTALIRGRRRSHPMDDVVLYTIDVRFSGPVIESTANGTGL